jgi:hypothetical protein
MCSSFLPVVCGAKNPKSAITIAIAARAGRYCRPLQPSDIRGSLPPDCYENLLSAERCICAQELSGPCPIGAIKQDRITHPGVIHQHINRTRLLG